MSEEFNLEDRPLAKRKARAFEEANALRRVREPDPSGERDRSAAAGERASLHGIPAPPGSGSPFPPPPPNSRERFPPRASGSPTPAPASVVDVGGKPVVRREAIAAGDLVLSPGTLAAIREKSVKKGDPFAVAEIAGIQAAKATPTLLPLCHPIPLTAVEVRLALLDDRVSATATVRAEWRTGVEMEALAAVTVALLTVWDMTKYLEKDERGQYPATRLSNVRVVSKRKEGSE